MDRLVFPVTKKEAERNGEIHSSEKNKNALFPSRLRALREKKGVSQKGLADYLGVSKSTVGLWETGDTLPDAKALYDMAKYFEVNADNILCLVDPGDYSVDETIRLVSEYTGLSTDSIIRLHGIKERTEGNKPLSVLNEMLEHDSIELVLDFMCFADMAINSVDSKDRKPWYIPEASPIQTTADGSITMTLHPKDAAKHFMNEAIGAASNLLETIIIGRWNKGR